SRHNVELDVFSDQPRQHPCDVLDNSIKVENLKRLYLLAAKCQQLPSEIGGTPHRGQNFLRVAAQWVGDGQRVRHQLGGGTDDHQQIVEVMGHAAGQLTDRVHFLGLLKLRFEAPPLGNIPVACDEVRNVAFPVSDRGNCLLYEKQLAVFFPVGQDSAENSS